MCYIHHPSHYSQFDNPNIWWHTLEIDEELCICFIDWQKAFDCKLDQINADPKDMWYRLA